MRYREFKVVEIPIWGNYLREKWCMTFASHLSREEKQKIGMDSFLWHLCSWGKTSYLDKENAISAFNNKSKTRCTVFYEFIDEAYLIRNAKNFTIKDLPYEENHIFYSDMYVMDWESKWTFIMTHQSDFGPYFIERT